MPVVLEESAFKPWLAGAAGVELLKPDGNDVYAAGLVPSE